MKVNDQRAAGQHESGGVPLLEGVNRLKSRVEQRMSCPLELRVWYHKVDVNARRPARAERLEEGVLYTFSCQRLSNERTQLSSLFHPDSLLDYRRPQVSTQR